MQIVFIPILIIFLDQLSKILVKYNLLKFQSIEIGGSFLKLHYIENKGIAFGIDTSNYHILIVIVTIIAIILLSYYYIQLIKKNNLEKFPLSFILGGAIGNCIDRILVLIPQANYSGVIDFIDIGINQYRWYIFNIADASITCGGLIYIYVYYKSNSVKKINDKGNI